MDIGDASDAARHWLHAELALLVAEGRWEDAAARRGAVPAALRARTATRPATPWRLAAAPRRSTGSGARTRRSRSRDEELELARRFGAPGTLGRALRVLGRLEREAGLRAARGGGRRAGRQHRAARARARRSPRSAPRCATRAAPPRRASRCGEALELAAACGAPALADEVRSELYATGARPRTDALAGVAALTASERRVADLAAGGETNRDIAQALFVTPKTVEVHLSNAYRKLGIRSRRELSARPRIAPRAPLGQTLG